MFKNEHFTKPALELLLAIYPIGLMAISYALINLYDSNFKPLIVLWEPFRAVLRIFRKNWESKTTAIDAFATFFLLSNVKFLSASFDLLVPVQVHQLNTTGHLTYSWRLYYDATVPYFGHRHLPYAILAIVVAVLFVLLPMLLLLLYPFRWFQKLLNLFPFRWYILHTFVDSFQGCYKNGTEPGTRDCRWFASVFLFARMLLFATGAATLGSSFYAFGHIVPVFVIILLINIQPFKPHLSHYSYINAMFMLLLCMWNVSYLGSLIARKKKTDMIFFFHFWLGTVGLVPMVYISVIIMYWIYSHRTFGWEVVGKLRAWRQGYDYLK